MKYLSLCDVGLRADRRGTVLRDALKFGSRVWNFWDWGIESQTRLPTSSLAPPRPAPAAAHCRAAGRARTSLTFVAIVLNSSTQSLIEACRRTWQWKRRRGNTGILPDQPFLPWMRPSYVFGGIDQFPPCRMKAPAYGFWSAF